MLPTSGRERSDGGTVLRGAARLIALSAGAIIAGVLGDGALGGACACAQCSNWYTMGPMAGVNSDAWAAANFDRDGPGPARPEVIVAGVFMLAGGAPAQRIASFDGTSWRQLGTGLGRGIETGPYALLEFDPDGPGPDGRLLIVGGEFVTAGGITANNIAAWDGTEWRALGDGTVGRVYALSAWDPDGDGPLGESLYAGGSILRAGDVETRAVARWDGQRWHALAGGINGTVTAMRPFDADADGPQESKLVLGGVMMFAGTTRANGIIAWDGEGWSALGEGLAGAPVTVVRSMAVFGGGGGGGEEPPKLVVCGAFTTAGGEPISRVAQWDGESWSAIGGTPAFEPHSLAVATLEGDQRPTLYLGGSPAGTFELTRLNGSAWELVMTPFGRLNGIASVDLGGDESTGRGICLLGNFLSIGGELMNSVSLWDGERAWAWGGEGVDGVVFAMDTWDRDGEGPLAPETLMGGTFTHADGRAATRVASWNGETWDVFGGSVGPLAEVRAVTSFDFDGAGHQQPAPVIGGYFVGDGSRLVRHVGRWDGVNWVQLGPSGLNQPVLALTNFDPDGAGGQEARLIAGGSFTLPGVSPATRVAQWVGSEWRPLGPGFMSDTFSAVLAFTSHDPDGPGPGPARLIAGGSFLGAQANMFNRIAFFNGTAWGELGTGFNNQVRALASFDADGDGPGLPELYAGGDFTASGDGSVELRNIARWDGTAWHPVGAGCSGNVYGLVAGDPDGAGPLPQWLIAVGAFGTAGGLQSNRIAAWDGQRWIAFNPVPSGPVYAAEIVRGEIGVLDTMLLVGGDFAWIGTNVASPHLARVGLFAPPFIVREPTDLNPDPGTQAVLEVEATGLEPVAYRWQRNGVSLADGPTAGGSTISGSGTPTLRISNVGLFDNGTYMAAISNACGQVRTRNAILDVDCRVDFDGNGQLDFFDYLEFLLAFNVEHPSADFDGNGQVDFFDYLEFMAVYDVGC